MTPEEAQALIRAGEGERVEFKESTGQRNAAVVSLGAFANKDGGTVFFGVRDDGNAVGQDIGARTLEQVSAAIRDDSDPPLDALVEILELEQTTVVAVGVGPAAEGIVHFIKGRAKIRVGRSNHQMTAEEIRQVRRSGDDVLRNVEALLSAAEDSTRPIFARTGGTLTKTEGAFTPQWGIRQVSGDPVADLEWRFCGPRFQMDWCHASGDALARTHITETFDLSSDARQAIARVAEDEIGLRLDAIGGIGGSMSCMSGR